MQAPPPNLGIVFFLHFISDLPRNILTSLVNICAQDAIVNGFVFRNPDVTAGDLSSDLSSNSSRVGADGLEPS